MISFNKLGEYGRLGNQLFQYAYIRTQAMRLGVTFYCPSWVGEKIFLLDDSHERESVSQTTNEYVESSHLHGFNEEAVHVKDDTNVLGYFQSDAFFNKDDVMKWFTFNESLFESLRKKYAHINLSEATSLHVRLGDYLNPSSLMFYAPTPDYFKNALKLLNPNGKILVFSEDPVAAKKYLGDTGESENVIFIEGNKDYEDFYLMSLSKDIVCSASTFSWWAAYLNKHNDKRIVIPASWFLPMCRIKNNDLFVEGWIRLKAHRTFLDNYYVRYVWCKLKNVFKL